MGALWSDAARPGRRGLGLAWPAAGRQASGSSRLRPAPLPTVSAILMVCGEEELFYSRGSPRCYQSNFQLISDKGLFSSRGPARRGFLN